jgi:hypothetical protein
MPTRPTHHSTPRPEPKPMPIGPKRIASANPASRNAPRSSQMYGGMGQDSVASSAGSDTATGGSGGDVM